MVLKEKDLRLAGVPNGKVRSDGDGVSVVAEARGSAE